MTRKLLRLTVVVTLIAITGPPAAAQPLGTWAKKVNAICRPDVKIANGKAKLANQAFARGKYARAGRFGLQSVQIGQRVRRRITRLAPPDALESVARAYLTTQGAQLRKARSGDLALINGRVGQARARLRAAKNFDDLSERHARTLGIYAACEKG